MYLNTFLPNTATNTRSNHCSRKAQKMAPPVSTNLPQSRYRAGTKKQTQNRHKKTDTQTPQQPPQKNATNMYTTSYMQFLLKNRTGTKSAQLQPQTGTKSAQYNHKTGTKPLHNQDKNRHKNRNKPETETANKAGTIMAQRARALERTLNCPTSVISVSSPRSTAAARLKPLSLHPFPSPAASLYMPARLSSIAAAWWL